MRPSLNWSRMQHNSQSGVLKGQNALRRSYGEAPLHVSEGAQLPSISPVSHRAIAAVLAVFMGSRKS